MTLGEFKQITKDCPDTAPIAIVLNDGNLDYVTDAWIEDESDKDKGAIIISGN